MKKFLNIGKAGYIIKYIKNTASLQNTRIPEKRFSKCILHIGSEKTGTSSIQSFLANNRKSLARDGIVYPSATGKTGGSQWGFVAIAHDNPWESDVGKAHDIHSEEDRIRYTEHLHSALEREFKQAKKAKTLLVSSEHMHSRLYNVRMIKRLKNFLSEWVDQFEVIMYIRRQDKVAVSLYSTRIKSGNPTPIVFPPFPEKGLPYYFNYEKIHENWSQVFGQKNVRVRLFSPHLWREGGIIQDFCGACGINMKGKHVPDKKNISLSREGANFIKELNRLYPKTADGHRDPAITELASFVAELCKGQSHPATRKAAQEFYQKFTGSNERLKKRIFPDMTSPLFDDDFSDYPETIQNSEPQYEEAVEMAVRIWKKIKN